jgi:hypothetical protein
MAIVLRGVYCRSAAFYCGLFCGKKTECKGFINNFFHFYGGQCLSRKAVHNWIEKFSQGLSNVTNDAKPGRPAEIAAKATVKRVE